MEEKTQLKILAGLIVVAIAISIMMLGMNGNTIQVDEEVEIGVIGVLSGNFAYFGQQEQRGTELAKKVINSENDLRIKLIYEDSSADPKKASDAINKLVNLDEVDFIVGDSWGGSTAPIVPFANNNEVILISPIATQNFLSSDDFFYRTVTNINGMTSKLAEYAYEDLEIRKIGMIHFENSYGVEHAESFQKYFEELGGEIVGTEGIASFDHKDYRTELVKLNLENPDAIYNVIGGQSMGSAIKQSQELGIEVFWFGHFGTENKPFFENYGIISDKVYYPHPYNPETVDKEFAELFEEEYGEAPNVVAYNSYNALMILYEAIEAVGTNTKDVKEYLDNSGYFDENGDVNQEIYIKHVVNGKPVIVK